MNDPIVGNPQLKAEQSRTLELAIASDGESAKEPGGLNRVA
jgi:hypothetical protein